jgi:hypothetical protein
MESRRVSITESDLANDVLLEVVGVAEEDGVQARGLPEERR